MDEKLLKVLEFDEILRQLAEHAIGVTAKAEILHTVPVCDFATVERALRLTDEAYTVRHKYLVNPLSDYDDIGEIVQKAVAGAVLRPGELLKVAGVLRCARIAKTELAPLGEDVENVKAIVSPMVLDRALETLIGDAIGGENEVRDDASEMLRALRRKIKNANAKLKEKLAGYTRGSEVSKYLQDNIVTVRMGRFVLPVKSECRSSVPGLIHDQSSSGATVFIEPYPVVELNNELKYLQMEEEREVERILSELSSRVAQSEKIALFCLKTCTMLDVIFAKMAFGLTYNGTMPTLVRTGALCLKNARHPLIDPKKVVPVTIEVGEKYRILVVTGPNTGGKTVCLKTTGLCCLMAYCGLPVPCEKDSLLSVYENVFCDLGDEQSIAQSLSTFSAHIVNLVRITDNLTPNSLVLLDELGAGTDPGEGAALSLGIVKYLELMGCKGIVTTHFNALKEYALLSDALYNACMQFDEQTLKPTYKLTLGIPGVSNALKIAGTYGLSDYILREAKKSLSEDQTRFETVLREAQSIKLRAENELADLQTQRQTLDNERLQLESARRALEEKQRRLQQNAKAEANRTVAALVQKANDLVDELKEAVKTQDEEALRKARTLRNRLQDLQQPQEDGDAPLFIDLSPSQLRPGMRVCVRSLRADGELLSLADKKGDYTVRVGNVRLKVKLEDLAKPLASPPEKAPKIKASPRESAPPATQEIKLLGLTVAEAVEVLEPHILSALPGSVLRVVHGKGTGSLGKGIQNYLKTRKEVASFRYGRYGEGDTGVTIVELK